MATQVDFDDRRKPAEFITGFGCNEKGSFREVVFRCNFLEQEIIGPGLQQADPCGVNCKQIRCKGIDVLEWNVHRCLNAPAQQISGK